MVVCFGSAALSFRCPGVQSCLGLSVPGRSCRLAASDTLWSKTVSFFIYIRLKTHENLLKKTGKSKKMRSCKEEDLLVEQTLMEGQKRILRLRSFRWH